jgi:hypothetical protein
VDPDLGGDATDGPGTIEAERFEGVHTPRD